MKINVLVDVRDSEVHIQELVQTPEGPALSLSSPFEFLGTVSKRTIAGKSGPVSAWAWESEGEYGTASTKDGAVVAMLADAGYVRVSLTATIPDLLADLGVDA